MKKLFVLIFTLTLSTNAFSWGSIICDEFLDDRNEAYVKNINYTAYQWYVHGMVDTGRIDFGKFKGNELDIIEEPPVTYNQMLYQIEKKCREKPTKFVIKFARTVYFDVVQKWAQLNKK
jgi:hypothetical protein|tara:strand:+ start:68 stop:424 length:357 start_codon:yes stop_codon:yes gene_type:complete